MAEIVTITVFDGADGWNADWPPQEAGAFLEWFLAKIEEVPEEHRQSAKIVISSRLEYDVTLAEISVTYERPETEEEAAQRKAKKEQEDVARERRERRLLEHLRSKYGADHE